MTTLAIGQRWRERDGRFNRIVQILCISPNPTGYREVQIANVDVMTGQLGRKTWASRSRFNGRSGGYEFASHAPDKSEVN